MNDNQDFLVTRRRFDNLFEVGNRGLQNQLKTLDRVLIIQYTNYEVEGSQLIIEITECKNKSIDEIIPLTRFVVESNGQKGIIYSEVGLFEDVICEDDSVKMIFSH